MVLEHVCCEGRGRLGNGSVCKRWACCKCVRKYKTFRDSRFCCKTYLCFIPWYLWSIDTHRTNFLKMTETTRGAGDASVQRATARDAGMDF